jgi:hypothetical protein
MHRVALLLTLLLAIPTLAAAESPVPPQVADITADEAKRVTDYLANGKDKGPLLVELVACLSIDAKKGSPTLWECTEPVSGPVKKGATVHGWTSWLLPKDGKWDDVAVQYVFEGQPRNTFDLTLDGTAWGVARARSFKSASLTKSGKWEIKILRGTKELKSVTVQVE